MPAFSRSPVLALGAALVAGLLSAPGVAQAATTEHPYTAAAYGPLTPVTPVDTQKRQVLEAINALRAQHGSKPLSFDARLGAVAQDWATRYAARQVSGHNPAIRDLHPLYQGDFVGENIQSNGSNSGWGCDSFAEFDGVHAVRAWERSSLHRDAMLRGVYTNVGVGISFVQQLEADGTTSCRAAWVANFTEPEKHVPPAPVVRGALDGGWRDLGAERSFLGLPTGDEFGPLVRGGFGQHFAGGSLYWSPASGAHPISGGFRTLYSQMGWENSYLGYPTSGEIGIRGGVLQRFQGGLMYWSPATGAHAMRGAILDAYGRTGYENGVLGFPRTSETAMIRSAGAFVHFQDDRGSIYWSPSTGAHPVSGAFWSYWWGWGGESGRLGMPTSDEYAVPGGVRQNFVGGSLFWNGRGVTRT